MTSQKLPLSTRLNRFWANLLAPINAYLGAALILLALVMAVIELAEGIFFMSETQLMPLVASGIAYLRNGHRTLTQSGHHRWFNIRPLPHLAPCQ